MKLGCEGYKTFLAACGKEQLSNVGRYEFEMHLKECAACRENEAKSGSSKFRGVSAWVQSRGRGLQSL